MNKKMLEEFFGEVEILEDGELSALILIPWADQSYRVMKNHPLLVFGNPLIRVDPVHKNHRIVVDVRYV